MSDKIDDDKVDYSLKPKFAAKQKHSKLNTISKKVKTLSDKKIDVKIAHQAIVDCTNQILILQKNLELYSESITNLIKLVNELEKELGKEKKNDA